MEAKGDHILAITYWYETYYEVYKGGQFFRVIDEMHAKYGSCFSSSLSSRESTRAMNNRHSAYTAITGPIIRITPNEVHFDDPDFNDVLYPSLGKRKIDRPAYAAARAGSKFEMLMGGILPVYMR